MKPQMRNIVKFLVFIFTVQQYISSFCTITRRTLDPLTITTMHPMPGHRRLQFQSPITSSPLNFIHDIIYCSSYLSISDCDSIFYDDEHFCSLLCDSGYCVHIISSPLERILSYKSSSDRAIALENVANLRFTKKLIAKLGLRARSTAIICHELSAVAGLRYLSDECRPRITATNDDKIAAVVIVDPPPLMPLYSDLGSMHVLSRYTSALLQLRKRLEPKPAPFTAQNITRKAKRKHHMSPMPPNLMPTIPDSYTVLKQKLYRQDDLMWEAENSKYANISMLPSLTTGDRLAASNQSSSSAESQTADMATELLSQLLGTPPSGARSIGAAMKDRILVISSIPDPMSIYSSEAQGSYGFSAPEDVWGLSASEELAMQYLAGPVIRAGDNRQFEDDSDDWNLSHSVESLCEASFSNIVSEPSGNDPISFTSKSYFVDTFIRKYLSSDTSIDDNNGSELAPDTTIPWTNSDVKRHKDIARAVSDWLDMITLCRYV